MLPDARRMRNASRSVDEAAGEVARGPPAAGASGKAHT